jgi:hypothetical protein
MAQRTVVRMARRIDVRYVQEDFERTTPVVVDCQQPSAEFVVS